MSILNSLYQTAKSICDPVLGVLLPKCCPICGRELVAGQRYICTSCRLDAPMTTFFYDRDNPMSERIQSIRPEIEHASSMLYYIVGSQWSEMIHRFKYKGEFRNGVELGMWMGYELRESGIYDEIDAVVAVPLHPLRQLWRGYNQSDYLAQGVAKALGVEHIRGAVRRKRYNSAQAKRSRDERWTNVDGLFEVGSPARLNAHNILLVDDVFTTGATILSCAEAILDAAPKCRIWIATLAVSNREFGFGQR